MIFVDTGVWVASANPADSAHALALGLLGDAAAPLFTTDYVVDETLTLLSARGRRVAAITAGERFFGGTAGRVYHVDEQQDVQNGWDIFRRFADKGWSFTDCVSRVVMDRHSIRLAFSFDHHFHQFGTISVVP